MSTPSDGNNSGGYGRPQGWSLQAADGSGQYVGAQGQEGPAVGGYGQVPPQRQSQLPELTEDMVIGKSSKSGGGWFRNPFARKKAAQPAPPANPWMGAGTAHRQPAPRDVVPGAAVAPPLQEAPQAPAPVNMEKAPDEAAPREAPKKKSGKKSGAGTSGGEQGNGWFRNPFAKSGTGPARSGGSPAQNWAGPRRGILLRRGLGLLGVLLLLFLAVNINRKASKADVEAAINEKVKATEVSFPKGAAVMWAAPLVKAFATYSPDQAQDRTQALAPYAINGIDGQMGWNGQGKQSVIDMVMSDDVQITDSSHGIVHSTVQIQDGSWRCVAVPLFLVRHGAATAFGLTAAPVYEPCSGLTTPPQSGAGMASNDSDLSDTFKSQLLPPFMAAWAQGDTQNLARYMLPGTTSFGLGGAYTGAGAGGRPDIGDVYVPTPAKGDPGDHRTVTFTVTLLGLDHKATQTSTYEVAVVEKNGQWYFAADPVPAVGAQGIGGGQLPQVQPTQGTGGMYSASPAPFPPGNATSSSRPSPSASAAR